MITRTPQARATAPSWQIALSGAVKNVGELLELLELPEDLLPGGLAAARDFPLLIPRGFVARMAKSDPADPLLLQVLPSAAELEGRAGESADPVGESSCSPVPGLLEKYRGRALLVATGACAVHCRYCFRRHFPYHQHMAEGTWQAALERVASDPSIREIILSGGDPLALSDDRLAALAEQVAAIPHLRRLRLHTRLPVVLPERVDGPLLAWLERCRLQKVVVIHANHPREVDAAVGQALSGLRQAGATVLNQSVLLRGVNDTPTTLRELSEALFSAGALPYYLHLLDPVEGAGHFDVPASEARRLIRRVAAELPGYLVPRLVREVPGAPAKLEVGLGGLELPSLSLPVRAARRPSPG
jgi:L-lysine 2,3-aminomutase